MTTPLKLIWQVIDGTATPLLPAVNEADASPPSSASSATQLKIIKKPAAPSAPTNPNPTEKNAEKFAASAPKATGGAKPDGMSLHEELKIFSNDELQQEIDSAINLANRCANEGNIKEAIMWLQKAEATVSYMHKKREQPWPKISHAYFQRANGTIKLAMGEFKGALDALLKVEEPFESFLKQDTAVHHPLLIDAYLKITFCYTRLDDGDPAGVYAEKAMAAFNSYLQTDPAIDDASFYSLARNYYNILSSYFENFGPLKAALALRLKLIDFLNNQNQVPIFSVAEENLHVAFLNIQMKNFDDGLRHLDIAESILTDCCPPTEAVRKKLTTVRNFRKLFAKASML
ncbi:MAG: hypothetical protein H7A33_01170 [Deltaproteobacteria bacterium]|nr:hypothetical protein [Deltaproteobacteria bacterium]